MDSFLLRALGLANENTGHGVHSEFQINEKYFYSRTMSRILCETC